jgi:ATP-binding cassette subfamily B protein
MFLALFCGALVGYAAAFAYAAITVSRGAKTASNAHIAATAAMTDSILNYETVKYFTAESIVQRRMSRALSLTELEWVGFYRRYAVVNSLGIATIFAVFLAANMLYAAHEVRIGVLTVGDFVLVSSYMLQVIRPVEMLGYAMQALSKGVAMLDKMLALFHESPEPQRADDRIPLGAGKLEFVDVCLSYISNRPVLEGVSFAIEAGKTLGVVGASGSGKSTLVRLAMRLIEPDAGRILLDGVPISELSLSNLRQAIAVVPQDTVLFDDTISYNIAFGREGSTHQEVVAAARLAHLHDFIMSLPEKYETRVGERGVKLSGGERQRVSIARATIKRPQIYVFDEATSSLDVRTEREILRNLQEVARASTTLVIAHRLSTVVHADEIVVLHGGVIVERGTHTTLLRQKGHYASLWASQQAGTVAA